MNTTNTTTSKEFKKNEDASILREIHTGDLVELLIDGKFFSSSRGDDKYAGYISSIDSEIIGLSPTHHFNMSHGYANDKLKESRERKITQITIEQIKQYRIL